LQSLVDWEGLAEIQAEAERAKQAALRGDWDNSTNHWGNTELVVIEKTNGVDFYNLHKFQDYWIADSLSDEPELHLMLKAGTSEQYCVVKVVCSS